MRSYLIVSILCLLLLACKEDQKVLIEEMSVPTTSESKYPSLYNVNDRLLMTWTTPYKDSLVALKYAEFDKGAWKIPSTVTHGKDWFVNWADFPSIVGNNEHRWTFVLKKSDPATFAYDIVLQGSSDRGETWKEIKTVHDDSTKTEHGFVSMLPISDQKTLVAWLDGRNTAGGHDHSGHGNGAMQLRSAIIDDQGITIEEGVIDHRTCDCCQTSMTMTDDGPMIVYRDRSKEEVRDIFFSLYQNNRWTQPIPVFEDGWQINGCPVNGPSVDQKEGLLAVTWFSAANNKPSVKLALWDSEDKKFGNPIIVSEMGAVGRVDLEVIDSEQVAVSWMEEVNGEHLVKIALVKTGVIERMDVIGRIDGSRSSGFPQMELVGDELIFAWTGTKDIMNIEMRKLQLSNWLKKK